MSYPIQNESVMYSKQYKGWYGFRDLEGDGYGQYMFKIHQYYSDMPVTECGWINPVPLTPYASKPEYFLTKEECLKAIGEAA